MPEPTEMGFAFQKAEKEREERERRARQSEKDLSPAERRKREAAIASDVERLMAEGRGADIELAIADEIQRVPEEPKEDSERVTCVVCGSHSHPTSLCTAGWHDQLTTGHTVSNNVEHPQHYNRHPSGIECIEIVRHHNFNIGSAIKYLWRAGLKEIGLRKPGADAADIEDLRKAIWYIQDEIDERLRKMARDGA